MKTVFSHLLLCLFVYTSSSYASDDSDYIEKVYKEAPGISSYEKYCILTSQSEIQLEDCLGSQPETELYKYEQYRRADYMDTFNRLIWEKDPDEKRDPWYTFCVHHSTLLCFDYCLNGWVCPHN